MPYDFFAEDVSANFRSFSRWELLSLSAGAKTVEPDIAELGEQISATEAEIQTFVSNLSEADATATPRNGSWSAARCLDHLALTNRAYLANMSTAADSARANRKMRRRPAKPGILGRLFTSLIEPPAKPGRKIKAPAILLPSATATLAEASASFFQSQQEIRSFLSSNADLDLATIPFIHPFIPGLRFSLATGVHILLAHERRHLWQAKQAVELISSSLHS